MKPNKKDLSKANKINNKPVKRRLNIFNFYLVVFLIIPLLAFTAYNLYFMNRVFPGITIAGVKIEGLRQEEINKVLDQKFKVPEKIKIKSAEKSYEIGSKEIDLSYDFSASSKRAHDLTRTGNLPYDFYKRIILLTSSKDLGLAVNLDDQKLEEVIKKIDKEVSTSPIYPSISFVNSKVVVKNGKAGQTIDNEILRNLIAINIAFAKNEEIEIPLEKIDPSLNEEELKNLETRAQKYVGKKLTSEFEYDSFELSEKEIFSFISPKGGYDDLALNDQSFKIASKINRDPQEPKFEFANGKVQEFLPAKDGVKVNTEKLTENLKEKLNLLENSSDLVVTFDIPVDKNSPQITTEKVNNLGIKELIGRGTSTYFHSIPGRVHNVVLATSRINGTLVKPGETFSFNTTLGDVSKETGYQTAYIIQSGKTVLGDGGGVCQVSTTLFRSILDAGLPVDERRAHAYRVGYYEQNSSPGIDATVYYPTTDFKFTNDTDNHILITAKADPKNYSLVFELYGTKDGREASITKPIVSGVSAPPPDLYQDDPTLPAGTVKQVDFKAWGAKVTFNYSVKKEGKEIYNKTFVSSYKPWQAVYLRGTAQ